MISYRFVQIFCCDWKCLDIDAAAAWAVVSVGVEAPGLSSSFSLCCSLYLQTVTVCLSLSLSLSSGETHLLSLSTLSVHLSPILLGFVFYSTVIKVILPHKQKRITAHGNKANIELVWYLSTVHIYMCSSKNGLWPSCVVLSKGRKKKGYEGEV